MIKFLKHVAYLYFIICGVIVLFVLLASIPRSATGAHCKIVGDREYVDGHCIPYCPPHPSECG